MPDIFDTGNNRAISRFAAPQSDLGVAGHTVMPVDLSLDKVIYGQQTESAMMGLVARSSRFTGTSYEVDLDNRMARSLYSRPDSTLYVSNRETIASNKWPLTVYGWTGRGNIVELPTVPFGDKMHAKLGIFETNDLGPMGMVGTANITDTGLAARSYSAGESAFSAGSTQYNYFVATSNANVTQQIRSVIGQIATGTAPTSTSNLIVTSPQDPSTALKTITSFIGKAQNSLYFSSATLSNHEVASALAAKAASGTEVFVNLGGIRDTDMYSNQGMYEYLMSDPRAAQHLHIARSTRPWHANAMAADDLFIQGSARMSNVAMSGKGTEVMLYGKHQAIADDIKRQIASNMDPASGFVNKFASKYSWLVDQFMPGYAASRGRTKYILDPEVSKAAKDYAIESGTIDRFEQSASLGTALYSSLFLERSNQFPPGARVPSSVSEFDRLAAKRTWGQESWGLEKLPFVGDFIKSWGGLRQLGNRGPLDTAIVRAAMWVDDQVFKGMTREPDPMSGEYTQETPAQTLARRSFDLVQNTVLNIGGYYFFTLPMLRLSVHARKGALNLFERWAKQDGALGTVGSGVKYLIGRNWDRVQHRIAAETIDTLILPALKTTDPILGGYKAGLKIRDIFLYEGRIPEPGKSATRIHDPITYPQGEQMAFQESDKALKAHPLLRVLSSAGIGRYFEAYNLNYWYDQAVAHRNIYGRTRELLNTIGQGQLRTDVMDIGTRAISGRIKQKLSFGLLGGQDLDDARLAWNSLTAKVRANKPIRRYMPAVYYTRPDGSYIVASEIDPRLKMATTPGDFRARRGTRDAVRSAIETVRDIKGRRYQPLLDAMANMTNSLRGSESPWELSRKAYHKAIGFDAEMKGLIKHTDSIWLRKAMAIGIPMLILNKWAGDVGEAARIDISTQERFRDEINSLARTTGLRRDLDIAWTAGLPEWTTYGPMGILNPITLPMQASIYQFQKVRAAWNTYRYASDEISRSTVAGPGVWGQAAFTLAAAAVANPGKVYTGTGDNTRATLARAAQFAQSGNYSLANSLLIDARMGPGANINSFSAKSGISFALQMDAMALLATPTVALSFFGDRGIASFSMQGPVMFPVGFTISSPLGLVRHKKASANDDTATLSFLKGWGSLDSLSDYDLGYISGTSGESLFKLGVTVVGATQIAGAITGNRLGSWIKDMPGYKLASLAGKVMRPLTALMPIATYNMGKTAYRLAKTAIQHTDLKLYGFSADSRDNIFRSWDPATRAQVLKEEILRARTAMFEPGGDHGIRKGSKLEQLLFNISDEQAGGRILPNGEKTVDDLIKNESRFRRIIGTDYSKYAGIGKAIGRAGMWGAGLVLAADLGMSLYGQAFESGATGSAGYYMALTQRLNNSRDWAVNSLTQLGTPGKLLAPVVSLGMGLITNLFDIGYETHIQKDMTISGSYQPTIGDRETFRDNRPGNLTGFFLRKWDILRNSFSGTYGGVAPGFLGSTNFGAVFGDSSLDTTTFSKAYTQWSLWSAVTLTVASGIIGLKENGTGRMTAAYIERAFSDANRPERTSNRMSPAVLGKMFHEDSPLHSASSAVKMILKQRSELTNWILNTDASDVTRHFFMQSNQTDPLASILSGLSNLGKYSARVINMGTGIRQTGSIYGETKSNRFFDMFKSISRYAQETGELGELDYFSGDYGYEPTMAYDNPNGINPKQFFRDVFKPSLHAQVGLYGGTALGLAIGGWSAFSILKGKPAHMFAPDKLGDILGGETHVSSFSTIGISPTGTEAARLTTAYKPKSKRPTGPNYLRLSGHEAAGKYYMRQAFVIDKGLYIFGTRDYKDFEYGNPMRDKGGRIIGEVKYRKFSETMNVARKLAGGEGIGHLHSILKDFGTLRPGQKLNPKVFDRLDVSRALDNVLDLSDELESALREQHKMLINSANELEHYSNRHDLTGHKLEVNQAKIAHREMARQGTKLAIGSLTKGTTELGGKTVNVRDELRGLQSTLADKLSKNRMDAFSVSRDIDIWKEFLQETHEGTKLTKLDVINKLSRSLQRSIDAAHGKHAAVAMGMTHLEGATIVRAFGHNIIASNALEGVKISLSVLSKGPLDYLNTSWEKERDLLVEKNRAGFIRSLDLAYRETHANIIGVDSDDLVSGFNKYVSQFERTHNRVLTHEELLKHFSGFAMKREAEAKVQARSVKSTRASRFGKFSGKSLVLDGYSKFQASERITNEAYHNSGVDHKIRWSEVFGGLAKTATFNLTKTVLSQSVRGIGVAAGIGHIAQDMSSIYSLGDAANDTKDRDYRVMAAQAAIQESRYMARAAMNVGLGGLAVGAAAHMYEANKGLGVIKGLGATGSRLWKAGKAANLATVARAGLGLARMSTIGGAAVALGVGTVSALPLMGALVVPIAAYLASEALFMGLEHSGILSEERFKGLAEKYGERLETWINSDGTPNKMVKMMAGAGAHVFRAVQSGVDLTLGNLSGWSHDPTSGWLAQTIGSIAGGLHGWLSWIPNDRRSGMLYRPENPNAAPSLVDRQLARSPIWYGSPESFAKQQVDRQERIMTGDPNQLIYDWFHEGGFGQESMSSNMGQGLKWARGSVMQHMKGQSIYSDNISLVMKQRALASQFLMSGLSDRSQAYGGTQHEPGDVDSGYFSQPFMRAKGSVVYRSNTWGASFEGARISNLSDLQTYSTDTLGTGAVSSPKRDKFTQALVYRINQTLKNLRSTTDDGVTLDKKLEHYARKHGVPLELALSFIAQESTGRVNAKSWVGAQGLGQIMPSTYAGIAKRLGLKGDPNDPDNNLDAAMYYMGTKIRNPKFKGNLKYAIGSYNAGDAGVYKQYAETRGYQAAILGMMDIIRDNQIVSKGILIAPNVREQDVRVTDTVRWRDKHPVTGLPRMHWGTDFAVPRETRLFSPVNSVVLEAGYQAGGAGHYVTIGWKDNSGSMHVLRSMHHSKSLGLKPGLQLQAGQLIGLAGATGGVTGVHAHIEYFKNVSSFSNYQNINTVQKVTEHKSLTKALFGLTPEQTKHEDHHHQDTPTKGPKLKKVVKKTVAATEVSKPRTDKSNTKLPAKTKPTVTPLPNGDISVDLSWWEGEEYSGLVDNHYRGCSGPRQDNHQA